MNDNSPQGFHISDAGLDEIRCMLANHLDRVVDQYWHVKDSWGNRKYSTDSLNLISEIAQALREDNSWD